MAKFAIVNTDILNLRVSASTTAQIVSRLAKGTVLEVVSDPGSDWLQVKVDGGNTQGYVSKTYVNQTDTRPETSSGSAAGGASGERAEVTTDSLNVRSGAGTNFRVITSVAKGTILNVLSKQGEWTRIKIGQNEGYVATQYLRFGATGAPTGFLMEQSDLVNAKLEPEKLIPAQTANTSEAIIAKTWNNYGGLLSKIATQVSCPVNAIVATIAAESGGSGFGSDGRMIIRFENHIFWDLWGQANPGQFNQFFAFDAVSGWKGHMFRSSADGQFQGFHGDQSSEWRVLTIARALNDNAALQSISMGAPQIMGFHYQRLGYSSVQSMFFQFARSANAQLVAMFDFVRGTNSSAPAMQALRNGDYLTFATIYNGTGNAPTYRDIITRYVAVYNRLIQTAR